jgi:hypothetical protein
MAETQAPDTANLAHQRQKEAATICRDAFGGPLHMRKQAETYLPSFPRESAEAYRDRLATSVFYDAYARTVDGLTGMVFRKPPQLADEVPSAIQELWENIDGQGTHGEVFLKERHRDGEIDGHFLIFVDMERVGEGAVRSRAQERALGLRPYWVGIRKQDVLGFRSEVRGGVLRITHLRYRETATEPEGEYREKEVKKVREYNLTPAGVEFIVWAHRTDDKGKQTWVRDDEGTMSIDEIPVAVGYLGERAGLLETDPPHLALALENVRHYQLVSDNDNVLHIASVPQLAIFGADPEGDQAVSPNGAWKFTNADAKMEYIEPQGNGLDAMQKRIEKSEHRMAILGLSTLMSETRGVETATSKRINKSESDSTLASHARATQDAGEEAIRLTAKWLNVEAELPDRGTARWLTISNDFEHLPLDAQTVTALAGLVAAGDLTQETLWAILQRGEILPDDFDPEVEREKLDGAGLRAPVLVDPDALVA